MSVDFNYSLIVSGIAYSMYLDNSDSVFIKTTGMNQKADSFSVKMMIDQHHQFVDLITKINLSETDTLYESGVIDGEEYRLQIMKNDSAKAIYIHAPFMTGPLKSLTQWLINLQVNLTESVSAQRL